MLVCKLFNFSQPLKLYKITLIISYNIIPLHLWQTRTHDSQLRVEGPTVHCLSLTRNILTTSCSYRTLYEYIKISDLVGYMARLPQDRLGYIDRLPQVSSASRFYSNYLDRLVATNMYVSRTD